MQTFTAPINTSYKIECWGASGGKNEGVYSLGAYTNGYIGMSPNFNLYIYVGQRGKGLSPNYDQPTSGTFNGGGGFVEPCSDKNNGTGGGATDVRLQNGDWNDFNSLKSRIMVAAGGGNLITGSIGSYGGALSSPSYTNTYLYGDNTSAAQGATQISGYKFGIGQDGGRSGAGGGYYGGCAFVRDAQNKIGIRGSGGSSFISGYLGCDAISSSSTEDNIIHTGQPNHYSGYIFTNSVMIDGGSVMPSPTGGTETGHEGNGYCIITWQQLPQ